MNLKRKRGTATLLLVLFTSTAFASPPPAAVTPPSLPSAFEDVDDVPLPDPDLWQRIRMGFRLDALDSPLVADQEAWYASRPEYIKRFVDRGSLYLHYIVEQVEKRGMPTEIALLPVIESAFNPRAYSRSKASGIWQFIPSTGKNYGLSQDWWKDNRRDIVAATDAALNYLQKLHDDFNSWELALAAYNCGEGCVARAIGWNQKRGLPTDYASLTRLPPETRSYVPKLFAVKNIVLSPASYGLELDSVPDVPYFTEVKAPPRIDVKVAAKLADMSEEDFIALNPAHNKAVASSGTLILPVDRADSFRTNLESYDKPLVTWTTYQARRGESLDAIARHNNLSLAQIKAANSDLRLDKRGRLRTAGPIMVPMKGAQTVKVAQLATNKAADAAPAAEPAPSPAARPKTYTVRGGDTLYGIAQSHRTSVETLLQVNRLTASTVLHPGLKLTLP
jgi:membrane-bound lytic murein transglycosylase D